jgi:hypothetical protein
MLQREIELEDVNDDRMDPVLEQKPEEGEDDSRGDQAVDREADGGELPDSGLEHEPSPSCPREKATRLPTRPSSATFLRTFIESKTYIHALVLDGRPERGDLRQIAAIRPRRAVTGREIRLQQ